MGSTDRQRKNLIDVAVFHLNTPLGPLVYAVAGTSIIAVEFGKDLSAGTRAHLQRHGGPFRFAKPVKGGRYDEAFRKYFDGDVRALAVLPFASHGSEFQRKVWRQLCKVPAGKTATYGEIANATGSPKAVRAVGLANGQNPISLIVPCHRIIGSDGSLTGYGGGMAKKRWLLAHELKYAG